MEPVSNILNGIAAQASRLTTKTHFQLEITGQPKNTFQVIHWQGEEGISTNYRYTLSLAANGLVDPDAISGQPATLSIDRDGTKRLIHGVVSNIVHIGSLVDDRAEEYELVLESPLYQLSLTRQSRVFLNLDLKALLEQVLLSAGLSADSFKIDLKTTYPVREYTAQFNETDFNFLSRQMEHAGVFYTFEQQEKQALLVIRDDSSRLPAMPAMDGPASLTYMPVYGQVEGEETVQRLQCEHSLLPATVKRKDYNYRTPETTLQSSATTRSKIPAAGTDYTYGERAASLEESEQLARRRLEVYDWQRETYTAETNCRSITAGATFAINGHPNNDNNRDYLVVSVVHRGDQSPAFAFSGGRFVSTTGKTYSNELSLIRKEIPYRHPVDRNRIPQVRGVISAQIETTGGEYAYLDDHGRYRLKPMFDLGSSKAGDASHPVRMMQPSAGANYGIHFPLHAGTEVLIACTNGDPDRPIILGAVSNPATHSPVTSANASQHTMRTFGGNALLMDDLADSEKIDLHTKDRKNLLSLDANSDGHKIALRTEEGLAEFLAKTGMRFESGDTFTLITGNDQTITVENKHTLQTQKKDINFNAGTDIALTAKQNIKLNAEEKDLALTTGQDLIIETGKGMSVRVMDGNSSYTIEQGSVSIEASNAITILSESGPLTIEQGGGKIEFNGGKLKIQGASVAIEGESVAVAGQQVGMMGGGGGGGSKASKAKAAAQTAAATKALFDDKFKLLDEETGLPLSQTDYAIKRAAGNIEHGTTDDEGHTHLLSSIVESESIEIFV